MSDDLVIFERRSEEVAVSTLNRSEKRNALSIELMRQLCAHAAQIEKDGKTRIWILREQWSGLLRRAGCWGSNRSQAGSGICKNGEGVPVCDLSNPPRDDSHGSWRRKRGRRRSCGRV